MIAKVALLNIYFDSSRRLLCSPIVCTAVKYRLLNNVSTKLPESVQLLKPSPKSSASAALKIKGISKAMKAYLERSKNHENFLAVKNSEFEIGRQHLANIMGLDVATLTQDDIDRAISYLLPSGLYEKKARPMMKPPIQMYPKEKAAQFDHSGRPYSPFFYTRRGNFYETIHSFVKVFVELDTFEDKMKEKGISEPPEESQLSLASGEYLSIDEIRNLFLENINQSEYDFFVATLNRLISHPYSFRHKALIEKYRREFVDVSSLEAVPELMQDENGRPFIKMLGYRKHCYAHCIVRGNGTGKVSINGQDISFFKRLQDREQVMFPLEFTDMLGKVDIEVDISGEGETARAGAIRHGLALCLRSFVSSDFIEKMRLAGLLTQDRRQRGRKIPGQKGCRAKYTWKKR